MLLHKHGFNYFLDATGKVLTSSQDFYSHSPLQKESVMSFSHISIDYVRILREFRIHVENILTHLRTENNLIKQLQRASTGTRSTVPDYVSIISGAESWFIRKFALLLGHIDRAIENFPNKLAHGNLHNDVNNRWDDVKGYWINFANEQSFRIYMENTKEIYKILREIERHSNVIANHIKGNMEHFRKKLDFLKKEEGALDAFSRNVKSWLA